MQKTIIASIYLFFIIVQFSVIANSQDLKSSHNRWSVYTIEQDGQKLCYMMSHPESKKGNSKKRRRTLRYDYKCRRH